MAPDNQNITVTKGERTDFTDLVRIADIASLVRRQREEVNTQLNFDEQRADIRKRIFAAAKETGEELSEEDAGRATEIFLSGTYCFVEPQRNFSTKLAEAYVDRDRLWHKYGIPAVVLSAVLASAGLTSKAIITGIRHASERSTETAIERAYAQRGALESELDGVLKTASKERLPETDVKQLREIVDNSKQSLHSTDEFFAGYCSDGTAADDITQENYKEAKGQLKNVEASLDVVQKDLDSGKGILKFQADIVSTKQSLESLIQEVRNNHPPQILAGRAEAVYKNGVVSLENRQLIGGQNYQNELKQIKSDAWNLIHIPSEIEKTYSSIRAIAKEKAAVEEADRMHGEAEAYVQTADVPKLTQTLGQLKELGDVLNQEYVLRIVNRAGVKSGMDRYYTDSSGKRVSGYYLIVEAVNSDGNVLQKKITNEEDGQAETVDMWGERVPQEVYERVKSDKMADGIVNDNVVGTKRRGYLTEKMSMEGVTKAGEITRW